MMQTLFMFARPGLRARLAVPMLWVIYMLPGLTLAQNIAGKVSTEQGEALIGASVIVKGTQIGALSDAQGNYRLSAPTGSDSLIISYIGFQTQRVAIAGRSEINITLIEEITSTEEVVITALGIERDQKALGYAIQTVQGADLTQARETNIVNSLAGKVAGVQVVGTPSGVGSSSRITIRGDKSLNINKNQPLFVVDGVPILNEFIGSAGRSRQEADYGNMAAVVNPDDVESITVLKGANASALYGSRANNGVILITTKSGKGAKGFGISLNSTTSFEDPLRLPDYQNVYGQGLNGEFAYVDGGGGGLRDGTDESWGPRFDGQLIPQYDSPRDVPGFRGGDLVASPAGSKIIPTPWVARPDNVKDFFETGRTLTNNIAIAGSNERGDFRISYTNLDQTGIVPNTDLRRNTIAVSGGYKLSNRLSVKTAINYIKSASDNRPNNSYGTENIMYLFNCWLGRQVDLETSRDYWQRGRVGLNQFGFNYNYHDNPYFQLFENTNGLAGDRIFGNIIANYDITDWLSLQLRTATDVNNELRARKRAFSTQRFPFGSYGEEDIFLEERNSDFLLTFKKNFNETFDVSISAGGNRSDRNYDYVETFAPQLLIPNVYNFGNTRVELQNSQFKSKKRINSLYALGQFSYKNQIFLDLTARNDWSSTLPVENNSYFYPSASLSVVLSDMISLPKVISYAKLRTGVAQVGNDTDPYQLTNPYSPGTPFGTARTFGEGSSLPNPDLKPELSTSFEIGADVRFLQGRLGLDFTYYNIVSKNQILPIPITNTSGYTSKLINAGEIKNWGYEVMLNATPVKSKDLTWDLTFNFSANRSEVVSLTGDIKTYVMASRYISVEARVGERMGDMYGLGFTRVSDQSSPYFGEIILDSRGRPVRTTDRIKLGNYNPDFLLGINNEFNYKGINFGFLFDIRQGGEIYSHTQTVGREGGQIIETLEGRANGYDLSLPENGVYFDGVLVNADGTYRPNTAATQGIKLSSREYHTAITQGRSLIEAMIYDASFVKLREVKLGYTLPNKLFGKLPFRNVRISAVGRNLALWTDVPHIDPENASIAGGTIIPGTESVSIPSARSYGFNLSLNL